MFHFSLFNYIMTCYIYIMTFELPFFLLLYIQTCEAHQHLVLTKSMYFNVLQVKMMLWKNHVDLPLGYK